jgi:DNA polymerase III epsilon subunit-like protein
MIHPAYVSVDVETSGPNPSQYSLLSIGACLVADPKTSFYVELKPVDGTRARPEALAVSGLTVEELAERGLPPEEAMLLLEEWLREVIPAGHSPIFVAFNAPFDWSFVNDYFYRFLGRNPFGYAALDIKAFYMGLRRVEWQATKMHHVVAHYPGSRLLTHHALNDAQDQAELFRRMLEETK